MKEHPSKQNGLLVGGFRDDTAFVKCFLCSGLLRVKHTVKDKPYFSCSNCELRAFISGDDGIERLGRVLKRGF